MRSLIARLLALPALLILLGPSVYRSYGHVPPQSAFRMKVVDPKTGQGVPKVRVRSDNGIVCHTRYNGEIAWTETVLMGRDVRFSIDSPDQPKSDTVTLRVSRGGSVTIPLR
jgi:hypothetical protein